MNQKSILGIKTRMNLQSIMEFVRNKDWDWPIIIDGDERGGKTTQAVGILLETEPQIYRDIECGIYENAMARITWSFEDMVNSIKISENGTCLVYDEASILGRESMKDTNLRMIRVMTTIGMKNRMYVWTFPSFQMLDPYLRNSRIKTRIYISTDKGERGFATFYARKRYPWPRKDGETVWWQIAFQERFQTINSLGGNFEEFWQRYQDKEYEHKLTVLESSVLDPRREIALRIRKKTKFTLEQIAELVGKERNVVNSWLQGIKPALPTDKGIMTSNPTDANWNNRFTRKEKFEEPQPEEII
jgi:hypothetical protein